MSEIGVKIVLFQQPETHPLKWNLPEKQKYFSGVICKEWSAGVITEIHIDTSECSEHTHDGKSDSPAPGFIRITGACSVTVFGRNNFPVIADQRIELFQEPMDGSKVSDSGNDWNPVSEYG